MNPNQLMVKMVFDRWHASIKNCDTLLNSISDEQLLKEIAPNKNRGIYVLGHLIAVHDLMQELLSVGEKLYPELYEPFVKMPDSPTAQTPSVKELRACWNKMNEVLEVKFNSLEPNSWFEKHNSVSAEDFIKEPYRNKLNIVITRTTHLAYHTGQLVLLK